MQQIIVNFCATNQQINLKSINVNLFSYSIN